MALTGNEFWQADGLDALGRPAGTTQTITAAQVAAIASAAAFSTKAISGAAGTLTLTSTYTTLLVGTQSGVASFALPAAGVAGRQVLMVDYQGNSATNNITTTVAGGGTINGASFLVTAGNYTQQLFVDNGSSWNA